MTTATPHRAALLVGLACLTLAVPVARAQVEVTAGFGLFGPTTAIGHAQSLPIFTLEPVQNLDARHRPAPALNAGVAFWASRHFGLEARGLWSPGTLARESEVGPARFAVEEDAYVLAATGRLLYRPFDIQTRASPYLLAGIGVIAHAGDAYSSFPGSKADVNLVAGVGVRVALGGPWALRLELEDNISWANFGTETASLDGPLVSPIATPLRSETLMQHEFVLSQSIVFVP